MKKTTKRPKTYTVGQLFRVKDSKDTYILAQVGQMMFNLINLKSGNRYLDNGVYIHMKSWKVDAKEFHKHFNTSFLGHAWVLTVLEKGVKL